ncbi:PIN domain protein [Bathymodiolus heckerae thiotrophic gill symbiont]|uniref:PIN domain-containing protein n=1 Tax=Bathymodiolus heckerae thiotrophic gill symbiont TaxID=1052212 RepID=UPI0010B4E133|nr:PIN domain-containing protein [Bathymodiolus heckerae thiotrophic gill symbiont]SHN93556.1 PIN domain protein [Bathymodiolus heckerae thiotrophic gill symbiont]
MRVLFDTNVILDVLLNRESFVVNSSLLMGHVEKKDIEGYLCATTITTLDYLLLKALNKRESRAGIRKLLSLFKISDVNSTVLDLSVNSDFSDFEDAVQYFSGVCSEVDALVTRNTKDYKNTELPIYIPDELLQIIRLNIVTKA